MCHQLSEADIILQDIRGLRKPCGHHSGQKDFVDPGDSPRAVSNEEGTNLDGREGAKVMGTSRRKYAVTGPREGRLDR